MFSAGLLNALMMIFSYKYQSIQLQRKIYIFIISRGVNLFHSFVKKNRSHFKQMDSYTSTYFYFEFDHDLTNLNVPFYIIDQYKLNCDIV